MTLKRSNSGSGLRDALFSKVAVVTGAASGIGLAIARLLSEHGATVVMVDNNAETLRTASQSIPGRVFPYECDISSWEQQRHLFHCIVERFFRLDIVCCNAGIDPELLCLSGTDGIAASKQVAYNWLADEKTPDARGGSREESNGSALLSYPQPAKEGLKAPPAKLMDVNVNGTVFGIKLAIHHMKQFDSYQRQSSSLQPKTRHIIVTGSAASYNGFPGQDLYSASKHALLGLVRATSRRAELEEAGISLSMVCPWLTQTPLVADIASHHKSGAQVSQPEDVARAFGQLLTGSHQETNGKVVAVHGTEVLDIETLVV